MHKMTYCIRGQHTHKVYLQADLKEDLFKQLHEKYPSDNSKGKLGCIYPEPLRVYKVIKGKDYE